MKRFILFSVFGLGLSVGALADDSKLTAETIMCRDDIVSKMSKRGESETSVQSCMDAYIKFSGNNVLQELKALGVRLNTVGKSVATARIPLSVIEAVSDLEGVECIQVSQPASLLLDKARLSTGVDEVTSPTPTTLLPKPFTGKGVIVAAIDGGVDFTHPAFYDNERKKLRLRKVWCQDDTKGTAPVGFGYGSEYNTEEEILGKKTDLQYYSHGSHVLNIAGGANLSNPYHGIAYDADLAFSNFGDVDKGISDALQFLFKHAEDQNQPIVVNMSLGTQMGPHDGTSLRDVLIDELTGPGRIAVGAAGNDGMVTMHIQNTFTESEPTVMAGMGFLADSQGVGELQIWGEEGKALKVNVCTVDKQTMEPVYKSRTYDCSKSSSQTVTLQKPFDGSGGFFKIVTQKSPLNGKPMAQINLGITDYQPDKVIAIMITAEEGAKVHGWANKTYCCFLQHLPNMIVPDAEYGVCEIGGTAKNIITVGSYNTANYVMAMNGQPIASGMDIGEISLFSNRGPSADGRMKPDVSAPGSLIISALNSTNANSTEVVMTEEWNGVKYPYGAYQGTSMASPHVAGIIALWLQAVPTLSPAEIRSVLSASSRSDEHTATLPNNVWGEGKIDALKGLQYILKNYTSGIVSPEIKGECWGSWISGNELKVLFYTEVADMKIDIHTISGMVVRSVSTGVAEPGDELTIPLDDLDKGIYILNIAGKGNTAKHKFMKR